MLGTAPGATNLADKTGSSQADVGITVDMIAFDLQAASDGAQPAYRLSHVLSRLANRRGELCEYQRDRLIRAIIRFNEKAADVLPVDIDRAEITAGLAAAFLQVLYWSTRGTEREVVSQAQFADMEDYARILRNSAHNSALRTAIKERDMDRLHTTSASGAAH